MAGLLFYNLHMLDDVHRTVSPGIRDSIDPFCTREIMSISIGGREGDVGFQTLI